MSVYIWQRPALEGYDQSPEAPEDDLLIPEDWSLGSRMRSVGWLCRPQILARNRALRRTYYNKCNFKPKTE